MRLTHEQNLPAPRPDPMLRLDGSAQNLARDTARLEKKMGKSRGRAEANGHNLSTSIIQRTDLPQEKHAG